MYNNSASPTLANCIFSHNSAEKGGGMYNDDQSSPILTNCAFSGNSAPRGGGMYNEDLSSPILTNCAFSGNSADDGGGMLNGDESSPILTICAFSDNSADRGGGMYNVGSSPILTNCAFSDNSAGASGGGMYNYYTCSTLANCVFSGNSADDGGGMYNSFSSSTLANCIFSGNSADRGGGMYSFNFSSILANCTFFDNSGNSGGGMYNSASSPRLVNCTFFGNSANDGSGMSNATAMVMMTYDGSFPTITNCIFRGGAAAADNEILDQGSSFSYISHSNIQGGWPGEGNIDADPLFVDPENGDFHLGLCSPSIDAGDNSAANLPTHDFEGEDRVFDHLVDMGIDETRYTRPTFNLTINSSEGGSVDTPGEGVFSHGCGRIVFVGAMPDQGRRFMNWTGDASDPNAMETTVIMDADKEITANFTIADEVVYVDADAAGENSGASWENAYTELQSALHVVASGQEIWISEGTYRPTARTEHDDPRSAAFQMKNGVAIYGGFKGTEENRDQRNWVKNVAILSGDIGTEGDDSDNSYHVFYHSGLDNTAILDGVTITKSNSDSEVGGGMYNDSASPTLANCIFSHNSAISGGGMCNVGRYEDLSSPTLTNCTFFDNSAREGGGMSNLHSSPTLSNCAFSGNSADDYGGGMNNLFSSSPILTNCAFLGNSADDYGGGMYNRSHSSPILANCAFYGNSARLGGGIINYGSSPILVNCTFSGNSADKGGGMYIDCTYILMPVPSASPTITNCIFWGNVAGADNEIYNLAECSTIITHSDIQGGWPGEGNIDSDPLFAHQAGGVLRLKAGSPCIDAGDNASPDIPAADFEGNNRVMDGDMDGAAVVDMGVDEFFQCATFNPLTNILYIPCLDLRGAPHWAELRLVTTYFELMALGEDREMGSFPECASYDFQSYYLDIPCVFIRDISHWADMRLAPGTDPLRLDLLGYGPNQ
ncbi:MAG: hypothetical protein GY859_23105 [Desulfobacterales bacterium]|nr:hypothetical protein [Desulfobacterales bacterium]